MHKNALKKVALFIDNAVNRRHYIQLIALKNAGFDVKLIIFKDTKIDYLIFKGLKDIYICLNYTRQEAFKKFSLKCALNLLELIKQENISIILTQRWKVLRYLIFCKFFKKNLKIILYIVVAATFRTIRRQILFKLFKAKVNKILVNSADLKEELIAQKLTIGKEIDILHSAIDPSEFDIPISQKEARKKMGFTENDFIFGMVARFSKAKDQQTLIYAFKNFLDSGNKSKLVLVGDGPTKKTCEDLAKKLGIDKEVIFTGRIDLMQIPVVLRAFDVFVHITLQEGMPMALHEAMAASLPVIATDAEGVPEIFDTSLIIGYLVPKKNVEELTKALLKIYSLSPEERKIMGENARMRLNEAFSPEQLTQKTVKIFKDLLNG